MNTKEMIEKFATGNYIAINNAKHKEDRISRWIIDLNPSFNGYLAWKLIHNKHKNILDAYLENNKVEILYSYENDELIYVKEFIETYSEKVPYRLTDIIVSQFIKLPNTNIRFLKPKFKCELFFKCGRGFGYGLVEDSDAYNYNHAFHVCWYLKTGEAIDMEDGKDFSMYNLTPCKEK